MEIVCRVAGKVAASAIFFHRLEQYCITVRNVYVRIERGPLSSPEVQSTGSSPPY